MLRMRWLTIITLLVLLFPSQAALAGRNHVLIPTVFVTPFSTTASINTTALYTVHITNLPSAGLHCVRVDLFVPAGYKLYPGAGYQYYHLFAPAKLDFQVKLPNTAQRKFFNARVSWSRDYACRGIRVTNYSNQVEIIVTKP